MKFIKSNFQFLKEYKLGKFWKPNFINVFVTILFVLFYILKNRMVPLGAPYLILILVNTIGIYLIVGVSYDIVYQYFKRQK